MIRALLVALLLPVVVNADPSDRFFSAYFLLQAGDTAEAKGDWATAHTKFTEALAILNEIKTQSPDWHPDLIAFRRQYCTDHLVTLTPKLASLPLVRPPPPPPPSAPDPTAELLAELKQARAAVKELEQQRDKLSAELQTRLQDPAPTDRETAKQTLQQLRDLQAANDEIKTKLAVAETQAARTEQLTIELDRSQQRIRELVAGQAELTTKLQEALAKIADAQTTPQIEELLKKNADLTAQLATAQSEIANSRNSSADTIQLRTELAQVRSENEQLTARLAESDRQLRAAKSSTEKDNQLIQQLRKENELLRQIADNKTDAAPPAPRGGFLWFKPKPKPVAVPPPTPATAQSEPGKLTATVSAPAPTEAARAAAAEVKAVAETAADSGVGTAEVRLLLAQAGTAIAAKDYATAKTYLTTAAEKDPGNVVVLMNLGTTLYQLGQLDEAQTTLRQLITTAPNHSPARSLLGIIGLRHGRTEDAYNELTRAVAIDPRNSEAHNYLGIVMNEKGWATAAEQEIRRALEINPNYADAHFNLAVLYTRQRTPRRELARYHYQKALELGAARDTQLETALNPAP
ncbi:MAG: hypothetical protein PCFJNLEI_01341 [Verrucomicrobiae bacterium]|nr:hypothetical protein [Verrucomicrobiae bacterium]